MEIRNKLILQEVMSALKVMTSINRTQHNSHIVDDIKHNFRAFKSASEEIQKQIIIIQENHAQWEHGQPKTHNEKFVFPSKENRKLCDKKLYELMDRSSEVDVKLMKLEDLQQIEGWTIELEIYLEPILI